MIPYQEIKKIVRFKLKDNNEIAFSDYEIKMAVNEVIRYLSISQALNNSDFLNRGFSYDSEQDGIDYRIHGVELPRDFVALVGVKDHKGRMLEPCDSMNNPRHFEYKINGDRLYCGAKSFQMMYKASIWQVRDEDDEVNLPDIFLDSLVQLSIMVLQQADTDIMHVAADEALGNIIPKRRYRNAKIKMPFIIGGRRYAY